MHLLPFILKIRQKGVQNPKHDFEGRLYDEVHNQEKYVDGRKSFAQPAAGPNDRESKDAPKKREGAFVINRHFPIFGVVSDAKSEITHQS